MLKSDLRGIETYGRGIHSACCSPLKSDLRGIETSYTYNLPYILQGLKSDLRGIETLGIIFVTTQMIKS